VKDIDFYSGNKYIALPSKKNPRVLLALGSHAENIVSFQLYNPFSLKARFLKKIAYYIPFFNTFTAKKSDFISFLEGRYQNEIITSVYYATDKDKVVLQIQTNLGLLGYLKVGLNKIGNEKIKNETKAVQMLQGVVFPKSIDNGEFEGHSFLLLSPINGDPKELSHKEIIEVLEVLNKEGAEKKVSLETHPRIINLYDSLRRINDIKLLTIFVNLDLTADVLVSYEHGDFAPWNVLKNNNELNLIDFEYFVENGLQEFDLIKYYYQVGTLLKKFNNLQLIEFVEKNSELSNFSTFLKLYLLKEICIKRAEGVTSIDEYYLLSLIEDSQ
jgi:hypothetical protein